LGALLFAVGLYSFFLVQKSNKRLCFSIGTPHKFLQKYPFSLKTITTLRNLPQ